MKLALHNTLAGALAVIVALFGTSCSMAGNDSSSTTTLTTKVGDTVNLANGLQYTILALGNGAVALPGRPITVNYTGRLTNGTVFDTSVGKRPFEFTLGSGQVILGWEMGVAGMKVGEKRRLVVPANLGYGSMEVNQIPPNSTLVFEIELLDVK